MTAKSTALAKQFEAKVEEVMATLEKLSEADWTKRTEAERWSVGVTDHHLASVLEPISHMIKAVVAGQAPGTLTGAMIDEMNAKHAKDYAHCTKEETIQLLQKGAAVVRGLSDDQLAKIGRVLPAAPGADGTALPTDFEELHVSRPVTPVSRLRPAPAQVLRLRVWSLSPNHALAEGEFMRMPTPLSRVVPAPMSCPGPIGG